MKMLEMCPFIRFAMQIQFLPEAKLFTSVDSRMFYIVSGSGKIIVDGETYSFSENSLMLWQPGTIYEFICTQKLKAIAINFDYTAENSSHIMFYAPIRIETNSQKKFPEIRQIDFEDCSLLNKPLIVPNALYVSEKILRIVSEFLTKQNYYSEKNSAMLKNCIVSLLREINGVPTGTGKIDKVITYIQENYSSDIDNSLLARLVNYHPNYLNRIFLKYKGVTLHQFIINYRISIAEQLLISTNKSVGEIAKDVGFFDVSSFTANFKNKNAMTATKFRSQFKNVV